MPTIMTAASSPYPSTLSVVPSEKRIVMIPPYRLRCEYPHNRSSCAGSPALAPVTCGESPSV
jgi:hypothetical protein